MSGLPSGWAACTVAEIAADQHGAITDGPFGSSLKSDHYVSFGLKVIRLSNVGPGHFIGTDIAYVDEARKDELSRHEARSGDIITAALGEPIGRTCLVPNDFGPAIVKADCFRLRASPLLERGLIVRWLNSPAIRQSFSDRSQGIGRVRINLSAFRQTPIPLPPAAEQRRIVAKIDRLSARSKRARDKLKRAYSMTSKLKQACLSRHFAETVERYPLVSFEDQLAVLTSGSRDWAKYYDRGHGVFVLAGNVRPLSFDPTPKRMVDPPIDGPDARRSRVLENDLLLTIVGAGTGDLCRVDHQPDDYFVCQSVALMRLKTPELASFYAYWFNAQDYGRGDFDAAMYGAARPHLSFDQLRAFQVPNVDADNASEIVRRIDRAFAAIDRLAAEAQSARALLDKLDQAILAKAFRGELVPQDPNDEPASVLLDRIRAERAAAPVPRRRAARAAT